MHRIAAGLVALAVATLGLRVTRTEAQAAVTLSIVGTNDLHGAVSGTDGRGGLALFGGFVANLRATRAADGGAVVLVDAGDMFQGTLESNLNEGEVVIEAYNRLGYAAAAIGNHEFDFGPAGPSATPERPSDDPRGALKARAAGARFPLLAANVIDRESGGPVTWPNVRPSTIVDAAGVRIGIIGVATINTLSTTIALNTGGLDIAPLAPSITAEARRLRDAGVGVIVVAAHAGGSCQAFDDPRDLASCAPDEEVFELARELPAGLVDVIVAGHRHNGIAHEVAGIAIMSSYWRGRAFGRVDLTVDPATGRVLRRQQFAPREVCRMMRADEACVDPGAAGSRPSTYEGRPVLPSADVQAILAPAIARADQRRNMPLGSAVADRLARSGDVETALGNLAADWTRTVIDGADVALMNGGGLRADLPAGPITYGRLFELMPFDNREALVVLTGAQLRRAIADNLRRPGSIMLVSGISATARCVDRELMVEIRRSSGRLVRDHDRLRVGTIDFLVAGGDEFFSAITPLPASSPSAPILREKIAEWLGRVRRTWRRDQLLKDGTARLRYPGTRPVTCSPDAPPAATNP